MRTKFGMSDEEAENFPHKHVLTMAIGTSSELKIRTREEELLPGDIVLLCSDGLTGPVTETAIAATLSRQTPLDEQAGQLISQANDNGGPDNVTIVLLRYDEA
jgi:protein phosphatase